MHSKLDDAKQQLLANAAEVAYSRKGAAVDPDTIRNLIAIYYRHAAPEAAAAASKLASRVVAMSAINRPASACAATVRQRSIGSPRA